MSVRHLLTPGKEAAIPFPRDYLFSRWGVKGSRLLLTVDVNKNAFAEINYGSGKDVGTKDVSDAGAPMQVEWLTSSLHPPALARSENDERAVVSVPAAAAPYLRLIPPPQERIRSSTPPAPLSRRRSTRSGRAPACRTVAWEICHMA